VIRLLAIDVDGTLLDGRGTVPPDNLDAVREAARRGLHVAVVTGRSLPYACQAVEALPEPLILICYNGAVTRARDGRTFAVRPLDAEVARRLLVATRDCRSSTLMQFDHDGAGQTVFDRMSWDQPNRRGYYARISHLVRQVEDLETALDGPPPVQVAFNGPVNEMEALRARVLALDLGGVSVSLTSYPARDFALVDVNASVATKGHALADVARQFGVDRHEVFAIGDNHNDLDMLQWAGTAVVMGNAEPELRSLGFPVTASHDEAGLAVALRRYVLAQPNRRDQGPGTRDQ
jgi:Cof subfamily protein (haloacid dehalogenase superfamily)